MRHFVKFDLVPLLSMLAVCFFPCFFLYAQNADEVAASTMVPFLVVFLLNSLVIFAIAAVFLRNVSRAAFLTDLSMLVVINFCLLAEKLKHVLPFLRDRYLLAVLLLLLLLVFVVLWRKKPDLRIGCLLVLIAFGSMIFMNLVFAVPTMLRGHKEARAPQPAPPQEDAVVFNENRPNVYYFIFDEYGGYENLLHYYDYDNSPFLSALADRGFNVSLESRNTEAVYTDTIVTNLLNLDYVVRSEDSGHKKAQLRDNTYLSQLFRQNGYRVDLINHVDYLGTSGLRVLTAHQTRRTISEYLMRNSIYHKFSALQALLERFFVIDYGKNYRSSLDNAMEAGLSCWQEAEDGPTLTIGYFQCPHSPTMVGPHGEARPFATGWNWRDHSLYLGQVEFMNDYILELVDTLQEHDPNALIMLQSDHGNRYAIHMMQMGEWTSYDPHEENPYMQNVLNCVYYQGEAFPIEGENGINTLRLVFRQVFGADLPPVEPIWDYSYEYADEAS